MEYTHFPESINAPSSVPPEGFPDDSHTEINVYQTPSMKRRVLEGSLRVLRNAALAGIVINGAAAYSTYATVNEAPEKIGALADDTILPLLDENVPIRELSERLNETSFGQRIENTQSLSGDIEDIAKTAGNAATFSVGAIVSAIGSGMLFGAAHSARKLSLRRRQVDTIDTSIEKRRELFDTARKNKVHPVDSVEIRKPSPSTMKEFEDMTPGIYKKAVGLVASVTTLYALPGSRKVAAYADRVINSVAPDSQVGRVEANIAPIVEEMQENLVADSATELFDKVPEGLLDRTAITPEQIDSVLENIDLGPNYQPTGQLDLITQRHNSLTQLLEQVSPSSNARMAALVTAELAILVAAGVSIAHRGKSRAIASSAQLEAI